MTTLLPLRRDDRGSATIEMALAVPILTSFLYGIFQIGVAYQAHAGMQHALGEGARLAVICQNPTAAGVCSHATNDEIKARIKDRVFGVGIGSFEEPTVTDGTGFKNLSVTFSMTPNFLFFNGPKIEMTRSKKVYTA